MATSPKILKAIVVIEGLPGTQIMDVIEHDKRFWLVPAWLDLLGQAVSKPARLIPLDALGANKFAGADYQFSVLSPVPKAVIEGDPTPEQVRRYGVVDLPNILVPRMQ